ncbi:MAG: hypothetical protein R3218_02430 [Christiangramia sp.]|nr:hypothetical protein [Christiangramia sp.]
MKKRILSYVFSLVISIFFLSCSSDDDGAQMDTEQFLIANVNGVDFTSDDTKQPLGFKRILMPSGMVNLYVKVYSAEDDIVEFMIENFHGAGKYKLGSSFYTNSWVKYERPLSSESWLVGLEKSLNMQTNYIEISSVTDRYIEGRISCKEMVQNIDGLFGVMEGQFRLKEID